MQSLRSLCDEEDHDFKALEDCCFSAHEELYADVFGVRDKSNSLDFMPDDYKDCINVVLESLPERDKEAITAYYLEGLTLQEIGQRLGVTRERVRQIISKALRRLRHPTRARILRDGLLIEKKRTEIYEQEMAAREGAIRDFESKLARETEKKMKDITDKHSGNEVSILRLGLKGSASRVLFGAGIATISQLSELGAEDLLAIDRLGEKTALEIRNKMQRYYPGWPCKGESLLASIEKDELKKALFTPVKVFGAPMVFTEKHLTKGIIPEGLFVYEVRHCDDDGAAPCEISEKIVVNFYGTLISKTPITSWDEYEEELNKHYLHIRTSKNPVNDYMDAAMEDWDFDWECQDSVTLEDYLHAKH